MIDGHVTDDLRAVIRIRVRGAGRQPEEVEASIDTGFDGDLTLPSHRIAELNLVRYGQERTLLADGSFATSATFTAIVEWGGESRPALVAAAETVPLAGMALLRDHTVTIQVTPGGLVQVEPLPAR